MLQNIEAIIFDLDGTLVDSMWMWKQIDVEYLKRFEIPLPKNLQSCVEGMSFTETAQYFKERFQLPDSIETIKEDWNRMAYDKYTKEVPLKEGVLAFLKACKKRNIKLGIATSNSVELVQNIIKVHKIDHFFDTVKTSCEVNKGKPAPDIYLAVAKELGIEPKKCLVFEDIIPGIEAGLAAGMKVCAIEDTYSYLQKEEKAQKAHYYVKNYSEIRFPENGFLPITKEEMEERGITQFDFIYVSGDAYVDHPSFGHAVISRVLEANGYTVGMIAQPDWKKDDSISILGKPRLAFLVSAGNMDSMVNHYFVSKKARQTDAYTPGGEIGKRPDYAAVVYSNLIKRTYRDTPIIIGGIEASLRRLAHYDYWSDKIKRSILLDSQADIISYGMGEKSIVELADALNSGIAINDISFVKGTVYKTKELTGIYDYIQLPKFEQIQKEKKSYGSSFYVQYQNTDSITAKTLVEEYPNHVFVVQNPPQPPLTTQEMDAVYKLPFQRTYHPSYEAKGGVPAITEIKFSLTSNRGCFGGCNFCALTFHQGRTIQVRSHESIVEEAKLIIADKEFKGYIHDVGGPTANFRHPSCEKQLKKGVCTNKQCLFPSPCANLKADHSDYVALLRKLRALPKVKKVFIRSGIRFDYLLADKDDTFFKELVEHHISGQLKVAPEHISDAVLSKMGKPENAVYERFRQKYKEWNQKLSKNQFLVPYLMSSHPGSTLKEAIALAEYLRDLGYMPEQVQDFYPTPSTLSTVMYYTQIDPRDGKQVHVVKNPHEKAMQRALIQYRNPKNYELVEEALRLAHREDLIGFDKKCLIRPRRSGSYEHARDFSKKDAGKNDFRKKDNAKKDSGKNDFGKKDSPKKSTKKTIRNVHSKKKGK